MQIVTPEFGLIFWQLVIFGIVLLLLRAFAWKPILSSLKERESSIEGALRMADQAKLEMQQLKAGNEKLLAEARMERDRILKEATDVSNQLIEQAKNKATEEGSRMIVQAREAIQNEKNAALAEVKNTAAKLSIDIAERILRRELADQPAQQQLVDSYLQEVKLN
ncbi:F0F1 ATP synthase subunit B [Hymenobacter sp. 5516J-16]|uniref:ATP synthase subunit b n=2 Tax=Hymenobacter TaxID=89966 RepID=A0ABY4JC59_9BACT|nr:MULTISPECIES: F0F1 ATP synthase subunit B [Hymenobacter]UOQ75694.1 F0F1 ATP synthase subunit B [Hymenobacter sp. 5516J-16]UPL49367.1 F0F1 ATP synthase subunit B [Hymenobacter sublimis]GGG45858.1 ATP synthase subunit b [Hymenobacter glacieicola]